MEVSEKSRLRKILAQVLPFVLVVVIFYVIFKRVKVGDVLDALVDVQAARFFIIAFLFVAATLVVDAYTHFVLFQRFGYGLGLKEMFHIRISALLFTSIGFLYAQGGMAWLVSRDSKRPASQVVGLLAFLFFTNFHAALLWVTIGMAVLMPLLAAAKEFRWLWLWILADWPLFGVWLWFWRSRFKNLVPARLRQTILYGFDQARPAQYFELIALRTFQFVVIAFFTWLGMASMEIRVPFPVVLSILPIQGILIGIPTPGRYGINEGAFLLLFHQWAEGARLVAFGLLWGTSANVLRALLSLIAIRKFWGK